MADLSAVDTTLKTMESQIQVIKERLQEERNAIPKAKVWFGSNSSHCTFPFNFSSDLSNFFLSPVQKLIEMSRRQQRMVQHMLVHKPTGMREVIDLPDSMPSWYFLLFLVFFALLWFFSFGITSKKLCYFDFQWYNGHAGLWFVERGIQSPGGTSYGATQGGEIALWRSPFFL